MIKFGDYILKGAIYILVFLFPIFFLPWTTNILDFNKQTLLVGLVSISLFLWILKSLISGKIELNLSSFHIFSIVFLVIGAASAFFSLYRYGSLWGSGASISESLLTLASLVFLYLLIANNFKKKEIFYIIFILIVSGSLALLYGIFQIFGKFFLPFDFAKSALFNTVGGVDSLAIFAAVIFPLIMLATSNSRSFVKALFIVALVIDAAFLILANFSVAWILTAIGSGLILLLSLQKRKFFDSGLLALPMIFLAVAVLFLFINFQIPGLAQRPAEIYLKQKPSLEIALQALKEKPVLGSGQGTFAYNFSLYKDIGFNQTAFWNTRFENPSSKMINILTTTGVLGILSFLALIGAFIFHSAVFVLGKNRKNYEEDNINEKFLWLTTVGIASSALVLIIAGFFAYFNIVLEFLFFILLAGFAALYFPARKEITLKSSSLATFGITFCFTILFIFSLGIMILQLQRYTAEVFYLNGLKVLAAGDSDGAINNISKAISVNQKVDYYFRDLSQIYLNKINKETTRTDLPKEEKVKNTQLYIKNAVNSATIFADLNPKNVSNWIAKGAVCQNLIGAVSGIEEWASKAYQEAEKLEPLNPYIFTQEGIVYLKKYANIANSQKEGQKTAEQEDLLNNAAEKFEKAVELKSDYSEARLQLASTYNLQGKINEALNELETARNFSPSDTGLSFQLGLAYFQNKDYDKAQAEFERILLTNNSYSNALYFLGLTYDKKGDKAKAIEKIEKVLEFNPDNEEVKKVLDNLKNNKAALEGIEETMPTQTPIEQNLDKTEESGNPIQPSLIPGNQN